MKIYDVCGADPKEALAYNRMMNVKNMEWNEVMLDIALDAQIEFNAAHEGTIEITRIDTEGNFLVKPIRLEITISGMKVNGEKVPADSLLGKEEFIEIAEEGLKAIILKHHATTSKEELEVTVSGNLYA